MEAKTSSRALSVAAFIQMTGVGLIVALLPGQMLALSDSPRYVGYLASAFAVPFMLFQLPIGRLGDRWGCKRFIVLGFLLASVTGLLFFRSRTAWGLLTGRFIQGIGEIPTLALAPALLSLLFTRSKGTAIGLYNASIHLGLTAGSLLSLSLVFSASGRGGFLLFSLMSFVAAMIVALFVAEPLRAVRGQCINPPRWGELLEGLRSIRRPAIHGGIILYGGGYGTFVTVIPAGLLAIGSSGQGQVSLFFALYYIAISVAQVFAGRLSDRRGRDVTIYGGLFCIAAGLALFALLPGPAVLAFLTLSAFGLGMFCVSALALLQEAVPPSLRGSASGLFYLLWGIGYFALPPLLGWASATFGYEAPFLGTASLFAAEALALRLSPKPKG